MFIFKAGVVGAGTMGGEIAWTIANADLPVVLMDVEQRHVDAGMARAQALWQRAVEGGKLEAAERDRRLALITGATSYDGFGDVDFVVEAVPEEMETKQSVFSELDQVTPGHAILASCTSGLSISEIAEATRRPDKVVGFHFFHPVSAMRLVEVVEGEETTSETALVAANFAQTLKKMPIRCGESPGFVVNRILNSAMSELWRAQEGSGAPVAEIDRIVTEAKAAPLGPFALADQLGLDVVLPIAELLRDVYGERFHVSSEMRRLVAAGHLGVKTGKGFYEHAA